MDRIESIILRSLLFDEGFTRRVLPFVDEQYFRDRQERTLFTSIRDFVTKYNRLPTLESIIIGLDDAPITQEDADGITSYLDVLESEKDAKPVDEWLLNATESWCQEQAVHNAVVEVINILDDKSREKPRGGIPKLLQDALAVCFDSHIGHDYFEDSNERFKLYHRIETRIPFHLQWFNKVTKNGILPKTLNVVLASTGVGKTLMLCDLASHYLKIGKSVLYITLEMAEERIAERIDANLMDVTLDELPFMQEPAYLRHIERIHALTKGRLIIKEYPTAQANVGHFRHLINDLALKKNFKPDVIFVDYLNICASARVRAIRGAGMYELVKAIAEELRGLGVECNVPIWTATQTNRAGYNNNDVDLSNTSESFGLPATADFMFALIADEDMILLNQILVKILKNRYNDVTKDRKFLIGVDRSKMKLYDLPADAQDGLTDANHTTQARPRYTNDDDGGRQLVAYAKPNYSAHRTHRTSSVYNGRGE